MHRRVSASIMVALVMSMLLPTVCLADDDGQYHGYQYFTASATEKYGVRGWFITTNPVVHDADANFSSSVTAIMAEVDEFGPWVEIGFTKGFNEHASVSDPALYFAFNDSPTGDPSGFYVWCDDSHYYSIGAPGSLHKYGVSRTGHNVNTGTTEWTWYLDGEVVAAFWMARPDLGHPTAGGETYWCGSGDKPHALTRGRNNGVGDASCYWCYKGTDSVWRVWNPDNAPNTLPEDTGGLVFTPGTLSQRWFYFDVLGE